MADNDSVTAEGETSARADPAGTAPRPGGAVGAAPTAAIDELLRRNAEIVPAYQGGSGAVPSMKIAIVLCMDARVDAHAALGLQLGEAHVIRNAGGVVPDDVLRSLTISQHALGTREVMVIHHTDCGLAKIDEQGFRDRLAEHAGYRPTWAVQSFRTPQDSVRESVRRIRASPFLVETGAVRGFVFDVDSGALDEVFAD